MSLDPDVEIAVVVEPATIHTVLASSIGPPGPQGLQGPPGGAVLSGWWQYSSALTPPPATGQVRTTPDPVVQGQQVTVYMHHTDDDGLVWGHGIAGIGDRIVARGEHGGMLDMKIDTLTESVVGPGGYSTFSGIATTVTGQPTKNARVNVSLVRDTSRVAARYVNFSESVPAASVPNNSIFLDSADNILKRKDNAGNVAAI